MFLASPSFFWNSLKRLVPSSASRMISIDHQSPIASSERAIGQSSFSKLVCFTMSISSGDHSFVWLHYKTRYSRWQTSLIMQPLEAPVRLAKKTAFITGGNSGIGLATAKLFVAEGAQVAITGRNKETLEAAAKELGPNAVAIVADATDIAATEAAIRQAVEKFGKLDVVFANAGIAGGTPLGAATLETFEKVIRTNITAVFFTVQAAVPHLNDGASIILNGSGISLLGNAGYAAYAASKAGVRAMARVMASELSSRRIRVNVVAPGGTATPIWDRVAPTPDAMS